MKVRTHVRATLLIVATAMSVQLADAQTTNQHAINMYNLGLNAYKNGSTEAAIIFFRRASDIDPNLADAQYNLGMLYASQRRVKEAVPRFQEVLRVKPNDPDAHYQLALSLIELNRASEARPHLAAIPPSNPHFADAQRRMQQIDSGAAPVGSSAGALTTTATQAPSYSAGTQNDPPRTVEPAPQPPATAYSPPSAQTPSYAQPSYAQQPSYTQTAPSYGQQSSSYAQAAPSLSGSPPSYGTTSQSYGGQNTQTQYASHNPPAQQSDTATQRYAAAQGAQNQSYGSPPSATSAPASQAPANPIPILANSSIRVIATGFSAPAGLSFDRSGNLYVANFLSNSIDRISPDGSRSQFSSGSNLKGPIGVTVDEQNNVYVANYVGGSIARINPAGISTIIATGFKKPYYVTLDRDGNLYVSQQEDNSIVRLTLPRTTAAASTNR